MHSIGNLIYERVIYGIASTNEDSTIRYYKKEIGSKSNDFDLHNEIVKVEKDNGFHDTSRYFENYLYFRNDTNWLRCSKTGLALTQFSKVFEGNISQIIKLTTKTPRGKDFETPKHWVVAQLLNDNKILVVDIFKDFYPVSRELQKAIIQEHKLHTE